jgi:gas vesicle protein
MNNGKFSNGFLLGLIIGGGAVFLLATETGRNLMKIVSERGMDGIAEILEEYNFEGLDEVEDEGEVPAEEVHVHSNSEVNHQSSSEEKPAPKKHFFKRIRK